MKTKIILELGCNHQGDELIAARIIDDAAALGVWGIKLQKRDIEAIPDEIKKQNRDMKNSFGPTYYEHRKALELNPDQIRRLAGYAKSKGLKAGISVFDLKSLFEMQRINEIDFIKLPSQLYSDDEIVEHLLTCDKLTAVSTGMHTLQEITEYKYFGLSGITFYCRSIYPAGYYDCQLHNLKQITESLQKKNLKSALGYSSHGLQGEEIAAAVLCGSEYIERHYTLDRTMKGSDHGTVSSDMDEMKRIIMQIQEAEDVLGESDALTDAELKVRKTYRGF